MRRAPIVARRHDRADGQRGSRPEKTVEVGSEARTARADFLNREVSSGTGERAPSSIVWVTCQNARSPGHRRASPASPFGASSAMSVLSKSEPSSSTGRTASGRGRVPSQRTLGGTRKARPAQSRASRCGYGAGWRTSDRFWRDEEWRPHPSAEAFDHVDGEVES